MTIDDLRSGDVLLFSPEEGSWISEAIVLLTGANVSHAALAYRPSATLVEATPPAVREAPAATRFPGRTITVRRPDPARPIDPVLDAATKYLDAAEPYPMPDLYLVGMLMLYSRLAPHTIAGRLTLRIFEVLAASVIKYVNDRKYPGKTPMVCSQFVFQCFQDAGPDHALRIEGGLLGATASLLDHAFAHPPVATLAASEASAELIPIGPELEEALGWELLAELKKAGRESLGAAPASPPAHDPALVAAVHRFAAAVHLASHASAPAAAAGDPVAGLRLLAAQRACFVTPADLLRSPSLTDVGTIAMPAPDKVHA